MLTKRAPILSAVFQKFPKFCPVPVQLHMQRSIKRDSIVDHALLYICLAPPESLADLPRENSEGNEAKLGWKAGDQYISKYCQHVWMHIHTDTFKNRTLWCICILQGSGHASLYSNKFTKEQALNKLAWSQYTLLVDGSSHAGKSVTTWWKICTIKRTPESLWANGPHQMQEHRC